MFSTLLVYQISLLFTMSIAGTIEHIATVTVYLSLESSSLSVKESRHGVIRYGVHFDHNLPVVISVQLNGSVKFEQISGRSHASSGIRRRLAGKWSKVVCEVVIKISPWWRFIVWSVEINGVSPITSRGGQNGGDGRPPHHLSHGSWVRPEVFNMFKGPF